LLLWGSLKPERARAAGARLAILKDRSPSCGCRNIHLREGGISPGVGVTAALLAKNGIQVFSEEGEPLVFWEEMDKG